MQQNNGATQKVGVFRQFANQLASQIVEQMCQEYEREVSQLYNDVTMYRNELSRCAELLGHQLHREKQLHGLLGGMFDNHGNMAGVMHSAASMKGEEMNQKLHELVDNLTNQHGSVLSSTIDGVNQAHSVVQQHHQSAKQLQEQTITAEHEFNRICQLLQRPVIEERAPAATMAYLPPSPKNLGPPRPGNMMGNRTPPGTPRGQYANYGSQPMVSIGSTSTIQPNQSAMSPASVRMGF